MDRTETQPFGYLRKVVVFLPYKLFGPFNLHPPEILYNARLHPILKQALYPGTADVAYERALEAFMQLKEEAEATKVSICLENVWNKFLLSPLEMRDFIDKINSPYVGVYLDVGNVIYTGYPEHWIRILGKRIKKVHFKDFRRKVGTLEGFVDLLAGDVNFPEVMQAFKEVGYDDYVTAEMIPNYTHYTNQIIYNTSKSMDRILGR
ncbi:MAG: L-ribulose-5-phosphate 3-epimerase [Clostridiales bacterium]|nr:L-ribulose-5-phosphate 3-epimerase [Clostridiales bacterium]